MSEKLEFKLIPVDRKPRSGSRAGAKTKRLPVFKPPEGWVEPVVNESVGGSVTR